MIFEVLRALWLPHRLPWTREGPNCQAVSTTPSQPDTLQLLGAAARVLLIYDLGRTEEGSGGRWDGPCLVRKARRWDTGREAGTLEAEARPFLKEETQVCLSADPWRCLLGCRLSLKGQREWGSTIGMLRPLCSCSAACSARCIINEAGFISSFWVANLFLQS